MSTDQSASFEAHSPKADAALHIEYSSGAPSWQAHLLRWASRLVIKPTLNGLISLYGMIIRIGPAGIAKSPAIAIPVGAADRLARPLRALRGSRVEVLALPGSARRIEKVSGPGVDAASDAAIVWFHGGGLVAGGFNSHRRLLSRLSRDAGVPVYSVEYRLLIEHEYLDAIADGLDAYVSLIHRGVLPARTVLGGDSGGAAIALGTALAIRDAGHASAAGLVIVSPWVDFDPTEKLADPRAGADAAIPLTGAWPIGGGILMAEHVLANSIEDASRISPINANLSGLPPTHIHGAATEVLAVDACGLHARLLAAGVDSRLKLWHGMIHVFQLAADFVPEGARSVAEIGSFVADRVRTPHDGRTTQS